MFVFFFLKVKLYFCTWWPKNNPWSLQGALTRTGDNGLLLDTAVRLLRPDGFSQGSYFADLILHRKVQNWLRSCWLLVVCCISVCSCQWFIHANAWPCVAHVIDAWKINHRYLSICSSLSSINRRCSQSTLFCTQDFRSSEGMAMAGIGGIAGGGGGLEEEASKGSRGGSREARAPHFTAPLMLPLWKHQGPRFTAQRRSLCLMAA